jgi:hypothetical protein
MIHDPAVEHATVRIEKVSPERYLSTISEFLTEALHMIVDDAIAEGNKNAALVNFDGRKNSYENCGGPEEKLELRSTPEHVYLRRLGDEISPGMDNDNGEPGRWNSDRAEREKEPVAV